MSKDEELTMLRARLAEIEKQEPVAWIGMRGGVRHMTSQWVIAEADAGTYDTPLYASPVQPIQGLQSVADALTIEQLNDKVERLMAVQPSQAGEVSKQDIYDIAHRKATRYVCTAAPSDVMYGFSEMHLLDFVAAINAKESGK